MQFTIRESRREDFDQLWRIDQECFAPGIAYSRWELSIYMRRPESFTLVAECASPDGNLQNRKDSNPNPSPIVGFIVAEAKRRRGIGHIITIDVLQAARRSGLGSQLLELAETRLRAAGCNSVLLETAVDNRGALAFYKRHNYYLSQTIPRYYSNGLDALLLKKELLPHAPAS